MRKEVKYIADDGTEFYDEFACIEYEEQKFDDGSVIALDGERRILDPKEVGWDDWGSYCHTLYIVDPVKARKRFEYLTNMYGVEFPSYIQRADIWNYDDVSEGWLNMDAYFKRVLNQYNEIRETIGLKKFVVGF